MTSKILSFCTSNSSFLFENHMVSSQVHFMVDNRYDSLADFDFYPNIHTM